MSPRITRSSARQAASQAARAPGASPASAAALPEPSPPTAPPTSLSRKRKVSSAEKSLATEPQPTSSVRRSKRQKIPEAAAPSEPIENPSHSSVPRNRRLPVDMDGTELVRNSSSSGPALTYESRVPAIPTAMETSPSHAAGSRRSARSKRAPTQSQGPYLRLSPHTSVVFSEAGKRVLAD
jgi:E3 ubiquitin-protein ligase TRIP12